MRALAIVAVLAAVSTPLYAQRGLHEVRNERRGFWASAGLAAGSIGTDCAGCGSARVNGPAGYLRVGGTLTRQLLLGIELGAWGMTDQGVKQSVGTGAVALFWYPGGNAFYLKVGVGGLTYDRNNTALGVPSKTRETGGAGTLGAGYDFRISRNASIVPFVNVFGSTAVKRTVDGTEVITNGDVQRNLVQLGIGFTLH
jgi:hypothetical protein